MRTALSKRRAGRHCTTAYGTSDAATTYTTYNAQGQVATQTDANGNVKTYLYDIAGREISATQPPVETGGPSAVTAYTYDSQNRLSTVVSNFRIARSGRERRAFTGNRAILMAETEPLMQACDKFCQVFRGQKP